MTVVAATAAPEIAPAPVRNGPGNKGRQGQLAGHDAKDSTSSKSTKTAGPEQIVDQSNRTDKADNFGCLAAAGCTEGDGKEASFDDAIDRVDSAAEEQHEAANALPPVIAAGVALPKFESASGKPQTDAATGVKGNGPLRPRADWLGMAIGAEAELQADDAAVGANVPTDQSSATVLERVRALKLDEVMGNGGPGASVDLAEKVGEPRARVKVESQEAHWNFASSPQRMSSRTVETLAVAGPALARTAGDGKPTIATNDLDLASPLASAPGATPAGRAGNAAGESGAGQSDSGGNRQANGSQAGDLIQQLRRTASTKSDGPNAVAQAGFATEGVKSPAQQVADAIVKASPPAGTLSTGAAATAPNGVLRRLDIKLDPANLGEVQVKMSLNANALRIDISAANADTAQMLSQDRQHIDAGLRRAGYDLVDYTVSVASNDATAAAVTAASATSDARPSSSQSGSSSQQSQLTNGNAGSNERGAGRNDFAQQARQQFGERGARDSSPAVPDQGGIYV